MNEILITNYLDQLAQDDTDAKPICIHGVSEVLKEMHFKSEKPAKDNFVESIEVLLNNSFRAYSYWLQNKRPIPIIKAKRLVTFLHDENMVGINADELWESFYEKCSGFGVNGGKFVMLPKTMSADLAYLLGVIFGDGCLYSHLHRKGRKKSRYGMQITDENKEYLLNVVLPKLELIFRIKSASLVIGDGNWYTLIVHSKIIYLFMKNVLGVPVGKKKGKLVIPSIVRKDPKIAAAFLRGLFDTDGWISKVPSAKPSLGLSQSDGLFLNGVKEMLSDFGIQIGGPYESGSHKGHELRSYNLDVIGKFKDTIGFEHPQKIQRLSHFIKA